MNDLILNPAETAVGLIIGSTILLCLGVLAAYFAKRPAFKQRAAELAILTTAIWVVLAVIPLPRAITVTPVEEYVGNDTLAIASTFSQPTGQSPDAVSTANTSNAKVRLKTISDADKLQSQASAAEGRDISWGQVAWYGYFLVSGCLFARVVCARIAMMFVCMRSQKTPPSVVEIYDSIPKRHRARLVISGRNIRPMSFGVLRPTIMLPSSLCCDSKTRMLRHVLLHEQAHVDRRDSVGNSILVLSLPLLWCHPLYWYLKLVVDYSRELIADDVAANQTDKLSYIDDLIELMRQSGRGISAVTGAIGVLGFRHPFTRRMSDLFERQERLSISLESRKSMLLYATAACVLLIASASFGARSGVGQDASSEPKTPRTQKAPQVTERRSDKESEETLAPSERFEFERGFIRPSIDLYVTSAEEGRVAQVHVEPGQAVKEGDLMVTILNPELEQSIAECSLNISMLEQDARSDLNVRDAEMSAEITQAEQQALRDLEKQNAGTMQLEILKSDRDVARAKLRVELANSQKTKEELELQREKLVQKRLQERLSRLQVRAPSAGVVEAVDVYVGQSIVKGERLSRLVGLDKVRVEFYVPNDKVFPPRLLKRAASIEISLPNEQPITLRGKVTFVSSEVSVANESLAWVECDNIRCDGYWAVRSGMTGQVFVTVP